MKCSPWGRLAGFVVLPILALVPARSAEEPAGPIVELPKFVVVDNRELPPPEAWRHATMPGFEILSNASDKATQRLLRDFDMFRQALGFVWPLPPRPGQTLTLILCGKGSKFDQFVPKGKDQVESARASLLLRRGDRSAIVIDYAATTLNVLNANAGDEPAGTDSGMIQVDHDKQLYREYVKYLLGRSEPRLPAWFEEGLSQIIMKMKFDRRWIEFAKLEDPNTVSAQAAAVAEINALAGDDSVALPGAPAEDQDFNAALRRRALVPLEKFFAVPHDAPEAMNPLGNNVWAKQAYAFVHLCLYGLNGKYQKPFMALLQRAAREPVTEALFKECFKMTYKQMLMEIRGYCEFTVYESKYYKSKEDAIVPPPPLALRDATEAEVGRIKGETMVLAGRAPEARSQLVAPYTRGERDPDLLAALGLYDLEFGEAPRARKFLEAAVAGKTRRPEAYVEVAKLRLGEAVAAPGGANGLLSPAQAAGVTSLLVAARKLPPPIAPVYDLLAEAWVRSEAKPAKEDVFALVDGVRLYPGRLKLLYQTAVLSNAAGLVETAHSLVEHGLKVAPEPGVRARFEALRSQLPPDPKPAAGKAPDARK